MGKNFYLSKVYGQQFLRFSGSLESIEETAEFNTLFSKFGSTATRVNDRSSWFAIEPPIKPHDIHKLGAGLVNIVHILGWENGDSVNFSDNLPENMQYKHAAPIDNVVQFRPRSV